MPIVKKVIVNKDPLTGQSWFQVPADYIINNQNVAAGGNIISSNFLNVCGMFSPTLYIEYDPATLCNSIDINYLAYQVKPRNITQLINTNNVSGGFNPSSQANGMFFSISAGILNPLFIPMAKIQIVNNDLLNPLNNLKVYIVGSTIPSGIGF